MPARALPVKAMTQDFVLTFIRYSLAGLLVAGIDLSVYTLLCSGMGVWYLYAHTLSRAIGGASGFVLNRGWTFGHKGRAELITHVVTFAVTYLFSYTTSSWLLYLWVETFRLSPVRAKLVAEGSVFLLNFLILRQWAFRDRLRMEPLGPLPFPVPLPPARGGGRAGNR